MILGLISCGDATTSTNELPIANVDPTHKHCYMYSEKSYEQVFQIQINGKQLTGIGNLTDLSTYMGFQTTVEGTIVGSTAKVTIVVKQNNQATSSNTIYETWEFVKDGIEVSNKNVMGKTKPALYRKINCGGDNVDTTLYEYFGAFFEGYAVVSKFGRYGLINEAGEITIPIEYADLGVVNEGTIWFYDDVLARKGIMDVNGNVIIPAQYEELHQFNEGLAAFLSSDAKWGFLDREGNVVIEPVFKELNLFQPDPSRNPFNEGLANVQMGNNRWNFIDKTGNVVIQKDFTFAKQFENGKATVFKGPIQYEIDKQGNCVSNCDKIIE